MTREFQIEQHLVNQAAKKNFIAWKWQSSRRGVPDRIVIGNGKVVFVELKAPGEKPTKQQEHVHGLLRAQGQEVWVLDSKEGVDELIAELERPATICDKDTLASAVKDMVEHGASWLMGVPGSPGMVLLNKGALTLDVKSLQMKDFLDSMEFPLPSTPVYVGWDKAREEDEA